MKYNQKEQISNGDYSPVQKGSDGSTCNKSYKINRNIENNFQNELNLQKNAHLNDALSVKNIKNQQFVFRMKLKMIACMQQLQIQKQEIQNLKNQQNQISILNNFISPIKRQFAQLKKIKEELLFKKQNNESSKYTSKNIQALQIISLQDQLNDSLQSQKRTKIKCQKLFCQNSELLQKAKRKQHEIQEISHNLYQTKLQLKQYQNVIQNLKTASRKAQKDFLKQKQKFNQQINSLKQLIKRQRQAKQIYYNKLQTIQDDKLQKQSILKRMGDQIDFLKKQCSKWKNRSDWKQSQTSQHIKIADKKLKQNLNLIEELKQKLNEKQNEITQLRKQIEHSSGCYNKKLQKIVEQWKSKLIETVQQYQQVVQRQNQKHDIMQKQILRIAAKQIQIDQKNIKHKQQIKALSQENSKFHVENQLKSKEIQQLKNKLVEHQKQFNLRKQQNSSQLQKLNLLSQKLAYQNAILEKQNSSQLVLIEQLNDKYTKIGSQLKILQNNLKIKEQQLISVTTQKHQVQNQMFKRISVIENNHFSQISKVKLQNEQQIRKLKQKNQQNQKDLQQKDKQIVEIKNRLIQIMQIKQNLQNKVKLNQNIQNNNKIQLTCQLKSITNKDINLFNNSNNTGYNLKDSLHDSSDLSVTNSINSRNNNLIQVNKVYPPQFIDQNAKKSSVRRVFIRQNSLNNQQLQYKMNSRVNQQGQNVIRITSTNQTHYPTNLQNTEIKDNIK